jgi:hypothetical protein
MEFEAKQRGNSERLLFAANLAIAVTATQGRTGFVADFAL